MLSSFTNLFYKNSYPFPRQIPSGPCLILVTTEVVKTHDHVPDITFQILLLCSYFSDPVTLFSSYLYYMTTGIFHLTVSHRSFTDSVPDPRSRGETSIYSLDNSRVVFLYSTPKTLHPHREGEREGRMTDPTVPRLVGTFDTQLLPILDSKVYNYQHTPLEELLYSWIGPENTLFLYLKISRSQ